MDPICFSLLFADKIFREDNGKIGIIGIFDSFNFPQFPIVSPPWWIHVELSNMVKGRYPFTINLVHDDTQAVVLPFVGELDIKHEEINTTVTIPIMNGILFTSPGNYTLTLNIDGKQITSKMLKVIQI